MVGENIQGVNTPAAQNLQHVEAQKGVKPAAPPAKNMNSNETFGSVDALKKAHPDFHEALVLGIATKVCEDSKRSTENLKKIRRGGV